MLINMQLLNGEKKRRLHFFVTLKKESELLFSFPYFE